MTFFRLVRKVNELQGGRDRDVLKRLQEPEQKTNIYSLQWKYFQIVCFQHACNLQQVGFQRSSSCSDTEESRLAN